MAFPRPRAPPVTKAMPGARAPDRLVDAYILISVVLLTDCDITCHGERPVVDGFSSAQDASSHDV